MLKPSERAKRPPQESVREAPFALVRDVTVDGQPDDGLTLDGYGAVFNRNTLIDSWEGRFWENIAPGSMKRSFRETPPKIQFDHGRHPLIGSLPVASLTSVTEDTDPVLAPDGGAHIIGRLLDNWLVQPVRDAISAGAVDGMSFRFEVMDERWAYPDGKVIRDQDELMAQLDRTYYEDVADDELLVRTLRQLKVPEMGPVTWPAYEDTSVGVRSKLPRVIDLGKLGQPETRKQLARAVFMADRLEAAGGNGQPVRDTPKRDSKEPGELAGSLDAILDQANALLAGQDTSELPDNVAQAVSLIQGAGGVSDDLLDSLGVYDPDDEADDDENASDGRDGQQPTETAGAHPEAEQQATSGQAGTQNGQRATATAGEHQPIPRGSRAIDLMVGKSRDVLLSIQARQKG
jgi:phage head maturation protease